jgi:hypothetical protein
VVIDGNETLTERSRQRKTKHSGGCGRGCQEGRLLAYRESDTSAISKYEADHLFRIRNYRDTVQCSKRISNGSAVHDIQSLSLSLSLYHSSLTWKEIASMGAFV